jgi:hypothetical protein
MMSFEIDRLRILPVQHAAKQRPVASQYFEQTLQRGSHGGSEDGDDAAEDAAEDATDTSRLGLAFAGNVMQTIYESLQRSLPDDSDSSAVLQALLRDISDGVQAGRRIPGDRWRLTIRLREDFLKLTNLEVACNGGELSVVFRTADENAYHCLVEALPDLNAVLERHDWGHRRATVFWVNPQELQ